MVTPTSTIFLFAKFLETPESISTSTATLCNEPLTTTDSRPSDAMIGDQQLLGFDKRFSRHLSICQTNSVGKSDAFNSASRVANTSEMPHFATRMANCFFGRKQISSLTSFPTIETQTVVNVSSASRGRRYTGVG